MKGNTLQIIIGWLCQFGGGAEERQKTFQSKHTWLVDMAGPTLWVFLSLISVFNCPEAYRANECLLFLLSPLFCWGGAVLTWWRGCDGCFEDMGAVACCVCCWSACLSTNRKKKIAILTVFSMSHSTWCSNVREHLDWKTNKY